MRKLPAIILTVLLLLSSSLPALAKEGRPHKGGSPQDSNYYNNLKEQIGSQDREEMDEDASTFSIPESNYVQNLRQLIGTIPELQAEEIRFRSQAKTLMNKIKDQVKSDRAANNFTALKAALADTDPLLRDINKVKEIAQANKSDWQQFALDEKTKNLKALAVDIKKLQIDIQSRIGALQNVLADLQRISNDLSLSAAPASATNP